MAPASLARREIPLRGHVTTHETGVSDSVNMAAIFAGVALAFAPVDRALIEPEPAVPDGWTVQGASRDFAPDLKFELLFAVKQSNLEELHDKLIEVSTPT